MSTLLPLSALLPMSNDIGVCYKTLVRANATIDTANANCQSILSDLATNLVSTDPQQFANLTSFIVGTYGSAPSSGTTSTSPFGGVSGVGSGQFGSGQGLINRMSILRQGFFALLEGIRKALATYGVSLSVIDFASYAAYQNALTAYQCLYTPDFATLFWYAYLQGQQLAPAAVFAPSGIVMATFKVTGSAAGTFTPGAFPSANGYTNPALGVNCGAVTITGANTCTTASLANTGNSAIGYISTSIGTGTGVITITDSAANTFTANVAGLTAGQTAQFVPTVAGTLMATPSSATFAGTATSGVVQIVEGGPTLDGYGNQVWIGGLPMAQGFAPNHAPTLYVSSTTNGTAVLTITAPNQNGVSVTWVTTITGGQSTGYSTAVIVGAGSAGASDRMSGPPTAISVSGAITSGSVKVLSGLERSY